MFKPTQWTGDPKEGTPRIQLAGSQSIDIPTWVPIFLSYSPCILGVSCLRSPLKPVYLPSTVCAHGLQTGNSLTMNECGFRGVQAGVHHCRAVQHVHACYVLPGKPVAQNYGLLSSITLWYSGLLFWATWLSRYVQEGDE